MKISLRSTGAVILVLLALALCAGAFFYAEHVKSESRAGQHRRQMMRDLLANEAMGLIILGPDGRIVEWSPGAEEIFGWTHDEVLGSYPNFLMLPECWQQHRAALEKTNHERSKRMTSIDTWVFNKCHQPIAVHIVAGAFPNHVGYYHMALVVRSENYHRQPPTPKPAEDIVLPKPEPQKIEHLPGVYYEPFQN